MIHGIRDGVYAQALVPNFLVADTISRTLCANRLADYTLIKMSDNEVIQAVTVLTLCLGQYSKRPECRVWLASNNPALLGRICMHKQTAGATDFLTLGGEQGSGDA